ncbi:hypothetical protein TNCV_3029851 [Trichonephila clavipes]|nr:hypothetical protein TNCV_3029851 [Trichonephila clavipes]
MALSGSLLQINLGVQGVTQGGHHNPLNSKNPSLFHSGRSSKNSATKRESLPICAPSGLLGCSGDGFRSTPPGSLP